MFSFGFTEKNKSHSASGSLDNKRTGKIVDAKLTESCQMQLL